MRYAWEYEKVRDLDEEGEERWRKLFLEKLERREYDPFLLSCLVAHGEVILFLF